jgi:hypothetical protein
MNNLLPTDSLKKTVGININGETLMCMYVHGLDIQSFRTNTNVVANGNLDMELIGTCEGNMIIKLQDGRHCLWTMDTIQNGFEYV